MQRSALELDHGQNNPLFASWKLSKNLACTEEVTSVEGCVYTSDHSTDNLSTRAAVLHNHINSQFGQLYIFSKVVHKIILSRVSVGQGAELKTVWGKLPPSASSCCTTCLACKSDAACTASAIPIRVQTLTGFCRTAANRCP